MSLSRKQIKRRNQIETKAKSLWLMGAGNTKSQNVSHVLSCKSSRSSNQPTEMFSFVLRLFWSLKLASLIQNTVNKANDVQMLIVMNQSPQSCTAQLLNTRESYQLLINPGITEKKMHLCLKWCSIIPQCTISSSSTWFFCFCHQRQLVVIFNRRS